MAEDPRRQWVLKKGDQIACADAVYTITDEPIGYGGSAVIYPARRSDTHLFYAIKECFPLEGNYHRPEGIITPWDPEDAASAGALDHFRRGLDDEQRTGQIIHNSSDRAICIRQILRPRSVTVSGRRCDQVGGAVFAVLDRIDTKFKSFDRLLEEIRSSYPPKERRRRQGLPHIYTTACLMEEVLTALQQVHRARDPERPQVSGYYFGDLHGGNIFFSGSSIPEGVVGKAHLIDFGSARELDETGFTGLLRSGEVYCAKGIRPPEMLDAEQFRLNRSADIFSAGCLMLRCVATKARLRPYARLSCVGPDFLEADDGAFIGCGPELLGLVNDILDRATAMEPDRRYGSAEEMLVQIRRLKERAAPLKNRLNTGLSTLADGAFVGREADRTQLDQYLARHINPIILHGFPGLGKTELAIDYARRRSGTGRVCFVRFDRSFRETVTGPIANAFSGYDRNLPNGKPKPDDRVYQEVLALLRQYEPDDLLIIDHADHPGRTFAQLQDDGAYGDLCALPMHLILTTRAEPNGAGQWHRVDILDHKHLRKMMRRHVSLPDEALDGLIDAAGSHTLMLDLMARTLARSGMTAQTLLESFRSAAPMPELPQIDTTHERSSRRMQLQEHLDVLFDLSGIGDDARNVLACAVLLPSEGLDVQLFQDCLPRTAPLEQLVGCGWLTVTEGLLRMAPVLREVCRSRLSPDEDRCGPFLRRLWECRANAADPLPVARIFAGAAALSGTEDPIRLHQAGMTYRQAGQYRKSLEYARRALQVSRTLLPPQDLRLAVYYSNLAAALGDAGEYTQALECQQQALHIRERLLPKDHPDLAASYCGVGTAFGDLGDDLQELEYQQRALHIRENTLPQDHLDLADSHSRVGDVLCALNQHQAGIAHQQTALMIREARLPPDHPDLASSHNNLGKSLCETGNLPGGLDHFRTALQIRQASLPQLHPALAQSHHNLAVVYGHLRNYPMELHHRLECLRIHQELLPPEDPKLPKSCCAIAQLYGRMGQRENELEFFLRALELMRAYTPEADPKLIPLYCYVSNIYREMKLPVQHRFYLGKAADAGHTGSMTELAHLLLHEGAHQEALRLLRRAYDRGDASAANTLGFLMLQGQALPRNIRQGHRLLLTAAERGSSAAHRHLGRLYLGQYTTPEDKFPTDPQRALYHLRQAGDPADRELIRRLSALPPSY